jgi:methylaspartate ammonia-lyase
MKAMTRILRVLAVPAVGGYYYEDLAALQARPIPLAERYTAPPVTPDFAPCARWPRRSRWAWCSTTGRWPGATVWPWPTAARPGRFPPFRSAAGLETVRRVVAPLLEGRDLTAFRPLAAEVDGLTEQVEVERPRPAAPPLAGLLEEAPQARLSRRDLLAGPARWLRAVGDEETGREPERVMEERPLHPAVRYGVSQALLAAVALARGVTMAEVIADEWGLPRPDAPVPIHAQSGGERHANADKMIVRRLASLPHALVDDIPAQMGSDGGLLVQYARWLRERIARLGGPDYHPTIHLDVHGALGQICQNDLGRVLGRLVALEQAVRPYPLRVESPLILQSREEQIAAFKTLRGYIRTRKMAVQIVADEWANTLEDIRAFVEAQAADMVQVKMPDLGSLHNAVEAVLTCHAGGIGAFLGGSCAETDLSARMAVHVALATRPEMILARPGMGVDEGVMLVQNEMARTLALLGAR